MRFESALGVRSFELLETMGERVAAGPPVRHSRQLDEHLVNLLQSMPQHWAIGLREDSVGDDDPIVRVDSEEVSIECCMVNLAETQTIRHDGFTVWIGIGHDMSGVKKLGVLKPADCAVFAVGAKDALAKCLLVESLPRRHQSVSAGQIRFCDPVV